MSDRHWGLTPELAESCTQAACVCLDRHYVSPIDFIIEDSVQCQPTIVEWTKTDRRIRAAWANDIDTTEFGAYACALAAVELRHGFVAVARAETRTGADFYVGQPVSSGADLDDRIRLEVSGTDIGSPSAIAWRLQNKLRQAEAGESPLPAIAAVVGFRARQVLLGYLAVT